MRSSSRLATVPMPSHAGHMPPMTSKVAFSPFVVSPWAFFLSTVRMPEPEAEATLKLKAWEPPTWGSDRWLHTMRSSAAASVAVPTVERELAPMRSWSTITAAERFSSESTSGRGLAGMNCWTKDG